MKQGGGFVGEDAGNDFDVMIQARMGEYFETGANGAAFWVVSAVNETWNAGLNHSAGAHRARFESDVKRGASETVIGKNMGGFAEDDDFGVGGRVIVADGAITGAGDDFVFVDKDGTDGNFAGIGGSTRFVERELHVLEVGEHRKKDSTLATTGWRE